MSAKSKKNNLNTFIIKMLRFFIVLNVLQLSNLFLQDLDKLRDFTARLKRV